jgi:hypothetical protein
LGKVESLTVSFFREILGLAAWYRINMKSIKRPIKIPVCKDTAKHATKVAKAGITSISATIRSV